MRDKERFRGGLRHRQRRPAEKRPGSISDAIPFIIWPQRQSMPSEGLAPYKFATRAINGGNCRYEPITGVPPWWKQPRVGPNAQAATAPGHASTVTRAPCRSRSTDGNRRPAPIRCTRFVLG